MTLRFTAFVAASSLAAACGGTPTAPSDATIDSIVDAQNAVDATDAFDTGVIMDAAVAIDGVTADDAADADANDAQTPPADGTANDANTAPGDYQNLVLDESGDPFCARFGNRYYLYLPEQVRRNNNGVGGRVMGFTSLDLVQWTPLGAVFDNVDDTYGGHHSIGLWAPEVLEHGGRYYLYYASLMSDAVDANVGNKDIVVIESGDPTHFNGGTRTVLLDDDYAFIDPDPFVDPQTGQIFLAYKRRLMRGTGSEIDVRPLRTPTSLGGAPSMVIDSEMIANSDHTTEQPTLWRQGGLYYLLFSAGDGGGTNYHIVYGTSQQATGPYNVRGTLFRSDANLTGNLSRVVISPGSSSIVRDGASQTWIVYRQKTSTLNTFGDRGVAIDRVTFVPSTPTINGTPSHGVTRRAPVPLTGP